MTTFLLSRTMQPESLRLATLAERAGWRIHWLHRRHHGRLPGREFAFYGETDLARRMMDRYGFALLEPPFDLLARMPIEHTRRQIRFMTLDQALALEERVFVKPADCTRKNIDACVYESGRWIRCADEVPRTTPVLVSEPVRWANEYRLVILEGKVVAFSPYIRGGWLARNAQGGWPCAPEEASAVRVFARRVLADTRIAFPPAFVLDVGQIEGRGWAIVEFNPVWCAGLLGCDLAALLAVLRRACQRRDRLSPADRRWVVNR